MTPSSPRPTLGRRPDRSDADGYRDALLAGLLAKPKSIPCKYFYDAEGSRRFAQITALPEYYLTRAELSLIGRYGPDIAAAIGTDAEIVEFGAGSSEKIEALLTHLKSPAAYLPIDISETSLANMARCLEQRHPGLRMHPLAADFTRPLSLPKPAGRRRVGFFPGSTFGNFEPAQAREFLAMAAVLLDGGGLLIGIDLVKDPDVLHAAYNDRAGVTAAFNKNLLIRANRELGANFDVCRFWHHAPYNPLAQCIEMYLVSAASQRVSIGAHTIAFEEGEAIHTESSYKYTLAGFRALAGTAGFVPRKMWSDSGRLFSLHWLEAGGSLRLQNGATCWATTSS